MAVSSRSFLLVLTGLVAGAAISSAGFTFALPSDSSTPSDHAYLVSLDEIRSNLVPAQTFSGQFTHQVTLSDGSVRDVTLRPVRKNGQEWVELIDKSADGVSHTYMGPNGTTVNGTLMINVKDLAQLKSAMGKPGVAE